MKNGPYTLVVAPDDYPGKKYRGRYVYEHQLVWWRKTSCLVPKGYLVHHKNENKRDNDPDNLELKAVGAHVAEHNWVDRIKVRCAFCKKYFELRPLAHRARKKLIGRAICCSRSCSAKRQRKEEKSSC